MAEVIARRGYRICIRCGNSCAVGRYVGTRGKICDTCRSHSAHEGTKNARLQETYTITLDEWKAVLAAQGNVCAICKGKRFGRRKRPRYDVDHDHALERAGVPILECLRGLLCPRCNRDLLPACRDDVTILQNAIDYLLHGLERTQAILREIRSGNGTGA